MVVTPEYLIRVFLVFVRIGSVFVVAPFFGHASIPVRVRIFFSLLLAFALSGLVPAPQQAHLDEPVALMVAVAVEVLTGVSIGYAAQFVFWVVQFAGEVIGFQMGLSLAQVFNPIEGEYSNPLGRILSMTFMLVFLLIDGHHHVVRALVTSFEVVPLAGANVAATGPLLLQWTGWLFVTALRIASPFMVTILLVDAALGVFARVVPQADLFTLGFPIKLLIGLGMSYYFIQNFVPTIPGLISTMLDDTLTLIEALIPV